MNLLFASSGFNTEQSGLIFLLLVILFGILALLFSCSSSGGESDVVGLPNNEPPQKDVSKEVPTTPKRRDYSIYSRQEIRDKIEHNKFMIKEYEEKVEWYKNNNLLSCVEFPLAGIERLKKEQAELYEALVEYRSKT